VVGRPDEAGGSRSGSAPVAKLDAAAIWAKAEARRTREAYLEAAAQLIGSADQPASSSEKPSAAMLSLVGMRLQQHSEHERALDVFSVARGPSVGARDAYTLAILAFRGAQSCTALLDFEAAGRVLERALELAPDVLLSPRGIAVVGALRFESVGVGDLEIAKQEGWVSVGRYYAAIGRLALAEEALALALGSVQQGAATLQSSEELVLFLAEIQIDRGRFAQARQALIKARSGKLRERSLIMLAQLEHLEGRFGEALAYLDSAGESAASRWQRCHTLASLNRLEEAERVVESLEAEGALEAAEMHSLRALIRARRSSTDASIDLPPTAKEVLTWNHAFESASPLQTPIGEGELLQAVTRTSERVREDFGRLFNLVLLLIHAERDELALLVCSHLDVMCEGVDSDLVTAKRLHMWALVYYAAEQWDVARRRARASLAGYEGLGMRSDAWSMARFLGWTLRRLEAPEAELAACRQHAERLRAEIESTLSAVDRVLYGLNKWTDADESVAALVGPLRLRLAEDCRQLSTKGRPAGRHRRELRRTLRRVQELRGALVSVAPEIPDEDSQNDTYAQMRHAISRRARAVGHPRLARWTHPLALPADTAVLRYIVLPDQVVTVLETRAGARLLNAGVDLSRPRLWDEVKRSVAWLRRVDVWDEKSPRLRLLSSLLGLEQLPGLLRDSICSLVIAPEALLGTIPFAALPVGSVPLVERWGVSVAASPVWVGGRLRLGTGFRSPVGVAVRRSPAVSGAEALRHVEAEIESVRLASPREMRWLVDESATRDSVLAALPTADCIHFACHGEFLPDNPEQSGLLLHDGWLTVRDLDRTELSRADVVVIASCWGASAAVLPGGECVGIPYAALDRGASVVISSIWDVGDQSASEIGADLHANLPRAGAAAALRACLRTRWRSEPPAEWAGYLCFTRGIPIRSGLRAPLRWLEWIHRELRRAGQR